MKITEALFAEHQIFHNLFDHIEATAPAMRTIAEVRRVAAMLETMLKAHSDTEHDLFLGPLEHCFEEFGQRDSILAEHTEIDSNLHKIHHAKHVDEARQDLLAAVAYSRCHFDKEERFVFPLAERLLKHDTLTALGQAWMEQRNRALLPS